MYFYLHINNANDKMFINISWQDVRILLVDLSVQ